MTTQSVPRNRVVLKRPRPVTALIALAKAIAEAMANSATTFPSPTPPLATLNADISALDTAQTATHAGTKGLVAARNDKMAIVVVDLEQERAYVQKVVDANPAQAQTIAEAAGMALAKSPAKTKPALSAKPATVSGSVVLAAKAAKYTSNDWQYSTDNKTWTSLPSTMQAKTTVVGLQPGVVLYFRHRAVTKSGATDWSQTVQTLVV
jgi:hypothetical protein